MRWPFPPASSSGDSGCNSQGHRLGLWTVGIQILPLQHAKQPCLGQLASVTFASHSVTWENSVSTSRYVERGKKWVDTGKEVRILPGCSGKCVKNVTTPFPFLNPLALTHPCWEARWGPGKNWAPKSPGFEFYLSLLPPLSCPHYLIDCTWPGL